MDIRVYKDALDLVEKEIRKLTMKGELTATEVCNLKEAVTAASKIVDMIGELPVSSESGDSSYSITPGFKYMYSGRVHEPHVRMRRGDRYSGHSIHDRMVAKLESMYDEATTDHERDKIDQAIRMIEQYKY